MDRKILIAGGVVLVILLIILGYFVLSSSNSEVNIGKSSKIKLPQGYSVKTGKNSTYTTIVNGKNEIKIAEGDNKHKLSYFPKNYKKKYSDEYNIKTENYTVGDIKVEKIIARNKTLNSSMSHYWYKKDNQNYHIFMKTDNQPVVNEIISSTSKR